MPWTGSLTPPDGMKRILFISLSNIGDAVMTTPALEALHESSPEAAIDIVAGHRSAPVFRHCPYRGEIFLKDKQKWLRGYPDLLRQLLAHRYDLVVDLRTDGFSMLLRASKRCQKKRRGREDGLHAVQEHLNTIGSLVPAPADPQTRIWLSSEEKAFAERVLDDGGGSDRLAIAPGCGGPEKVWPPEKFAELADRLQDRFSEVVLLGGPGDVSYAQRLLQTTSCRARDLTGQTDILQAAAVIRHCRLFIGNDSGLGHLASAVSTPSLTLFGVGHPERYHPWQRTAAWLQDPGREIRNIPVQAVYDGVQDLLA